MTKRKHDLVDIEVHLHMDREDRAAIAVTLDGSGPWVWLPRSMIEWEAKPGTSTITVTLPETLAVEKGLV